MAQELLIGTSGWSYEGWAQGLYAGVPRSGWLKRYAEVFDAVEIDASFYREQRPQTLEAWREATPPSFRFALKGHRYLTHNKKLLDPIPSLLRQKENAMRLGPKLAAMLWQTPRRLAKDMPRLRGFLDALSLWPEVRHAIELRHASWFDDETAETLRRAGAGICLSDAADWPMWDKVASDLVYIRLHGHEKTYWSAYGHDALRLWTKKVQGFLQEGLSVCLFFDNTDEGAAVENALTAKELLSPRSTSLYGQGK